MIKIIVNGAKGRLGSVAVATIQQAADLQLVATCGRQDDLTVKIKATQADIVIDVTNAESVYANSKIIIAAGAHPIIGSSGLTTEQITELQALCHQQQLGGIIAANFSIGAVLMMRFAAQAAHYFNAAEIIELHHEKKKDAPSGTALKTAALIGNIRPNQTISCKETLPGALGAQHQSIPIHSIRMPGLLAHQEVIFGNTGELLTIRHDTTDRQCFAAGILLCCRQVMKLTTLIYGLEHLL